MKDHLTLLLFDIVLNRNFDVYRDTNPVEIQHCWLFSNLIITTD
jgi:hypothetical protein